MMVLSERLMMDQDFYLAEVGWDDTGKPVDIFYKDENSAAVAMIGQQVKGKFLSKR